MTTTSTDSGERPGSVAIVAMGPSRTDYIHESVMQSSRLRVADEIWAINSMGGVIQHDRLFCMDALPYFSRAARKENLHLIGYQDWLPFHPGPIYTQRKYPGFPGSVEYPLKEVLDDLGEPYFNGTPPYAIAYAIHLGVREIRLYGMDYTQVDRGLAEAGRACVEYWVAVALSRKIHIAIAPSSTLLDTVYMTRRRMTHRPLYGYTTQPLIERGKDDKFIVELAPLTDKEKPE